MTLPSFGPDLRTRKDANNATKFKISGEDHKGLNFNRTVRTMVRMTFRRSVWPWHNCRKIIFQTEIKANKKVRIQNFDDTGRGMGAQKDIYKGDSILSIQNVITVRDPRMIWFDHWRSIFRIEPRYLVRRSLITARVIIKSCPELVLMMESQDFKIKQIDVFELLILWLLFEDSKGKESARVSIVSNRCLSVQWS